MITSIFYYPYSHNVGTHPSCRHTEYKTRSGKVYLSDDIFVKDSNVNSPAIKLCGDEFECWLSENFPNYIKDDLSVIYFSYYNISAYVSILFERIVLDTLNGKKEDLNELKSDKVFLKYLDLGKSFNKFVDAVNRHSYCQTSDPYLLELDVNYCSNHKQWYISSKNHEYSYKEDEADYDTKEEACEDIELEFMEIDHEYVKTDNLQENVNYRTVFYYFKLYVILRTRQIIQNIPYNKEACFKDNPFKNYKRLLDLVSAYEEVLNVALQLDEIHNTY